MGLISTLGTSLLTSAVYDVVKYMIIKLVGRNEFQKKEKDLLKRINSELYSDIPEENRQVFDSGTFIDYLNSHRFFDIISAYLEQKIFTNYASKQTSIRKYINSANIVTTQTMLNHLTDKLLMLYHENDVLNPPSRDNIYTALDRLFVVCEKCIVSSLSLDDAKMLYLINSKMDGAAAKIIDHINTLQNDLQILEKKLFSTRCNPENFETTRKQYCEILKSKNSEAHIYLLDKFPFESFYVPPVLCKPGRHPRIHSQHYSWNNIFIDNNIVYVTGGAGYGKSLFQKKIINDFERLNIFRPEEYIVMYGELKYFYSNNVDSPVSVIEFLKNSIRTSTLIDVSTEFVQHYLDAGRCILLLDALDEVDKTKRASLHESIISFLKKQNPNNKICITSRDRGFIPEKNIEVFNICPLEENQIEKYVDNMIALGKFEEEDKDSFINQTKKLIEKDFLNSFLVLSLLINIYKAERELPENKLELYQKCFDYIANKREKEKTSKEFDWLKISPLMKDSTFIELSKMCIPNNSNVEREQIKHSLLNVYKTKYASEVDAENALDEFLKFCSERTELFVPSQEEKFKFFHRSFFEYFYAKYISSRIYTANARLDELLNFDVDSEVFELTVAMLKQQHEQEYQELIQLMFDHAIEELNMETSIFQVFNILILSMQVVDDAVYLERFSTLIVEYKDTILKNLEKLQNLHLIIDIFRGANPYSDKICDAYEEESLLSILKNCVTVFSVIDEYPNREGEKVLDKELSYREILPENRRTIFHRKDDWYSFYVRMYVNTKDCHAILSSIDDDTIISVHKQFRPNNYKRAARNAIEAVNRYRKLSPSRQRNCLKTITSYFGFLDRTIFIV